MICRQLFGSKQAPPSFHPVTAWRMAVSRPVPPLTKPGSVPWNTLPFITSLVSSQKIPTPSSRKPAFPFWAILTGLIDALPVFGTGTIFFPWILIVALQKDYTLALWLGLLYLVTWLTRERLEPKLLGDGLGLLPICFLISVISGLKLFGALGLFSGPFGVLLIRELWKELEENLSQKNHLTL